MSRSVNGISLRGTSIKDRRYYRDTSSIERLCDCPQLTVRADPLEESFAATLKHFTDGWQGNLPQTAQDAAVAQVEMRYQRAKELYMQGEIT